MPKGGVCSVRTLPFPREAFRAHGISRSGFKLQGPTTRRSTSPGTLGPARGGTDPSVHGQPTVPTSLREDASLSFRIPTALRKDRRDTHVAKGPSAECRPQDETPALRRDRRRFTYVLRLSTDGNHRSDHYSPGPAFWAASEATRSPDRTAAHLGESLRSSLRPDLTPRSVRLI